MRFKRHPNFDTRQFVSAFGIGNICSTIEGYLKKQRFTLHQRQNNVPKECIVYFRSTA